MGKYYDGVLAFMFRQLFYKIPANPKVDLYGKTFLITGANTGVGFACATQLVGCGARVVLAVRSVSKGEAARNEIITQYPAVTIEVKECDLASL
jgi:NAD(P)-dependent dehydrogenase (short-subunit alcohol dehydrogenase family)